MAVRRVALLQREDELELVGQWLAEASQGLGRVALVLAGAGLGKTSLLREAASLGRARAMTVLAARGGELEQEMGFGIARQLFEAPMLALDEEERATVAGGAAEVALPVVTAAGQSSGDALGVVHGLYWLAANLAERAPLLLVVDDAHWADDQTLRWLAYLAPRVESLPVLALVAARPAEPGAERSVLSALAGEGDVPVLGLAPLAGDAVGELIRERLGRTAEPEFAAAIERASGGNPFFVGELLRAATDADIAPVAASAGYVAGLAPAQATQSIVARLDRAGEPARRLAQAVAVLGADADLRHVAALAEMQVEDALDLVAVLVGAGILRDIRPLDFVHPIVRTAVYEQLRPGERTRQHRRAAELIESDGGPPERAALQAFATEPAGDPATVARLRSAAAAARASGAPDAAARYLRRALDEPPEPAARAEVALELGQALIGVDYAAAAASFEAAAATEDIPVRIDAHRWRAQTLAFTGDPASAVAVLEDAIALAQGPEQRLLLTATRDFYALGWLGDPDWRRRSEAIQVRAAELAGRTPGERRALAAAALDIARTGMEPAARSIELADRVRAAFATWLDTEPGIETPAGIGESSIIGEDPKALARHEEVAGGSPRRLGMTAPVAGAHAQLADIRLRRGELFGAEADGRLSWQLMESARETAPTNRWFALSALVAALVARGGLEEAEELTSSAGMRDATIDEICTFPLTPIAPVVLGELDLALGRTTEGIERLMRDGAWLEEHGWANPSLNPWRARVAPALAMTGRVEEARDVIGPGLERARRFGAPWALGMALRAAGTVAQGEEGIVLLREAIEVLETGGCRVEHAHALIELGAALRRRNSRAEAREHLRLALDVATRAGAAPLAGRAREELAASGARPRRELLSGVEALTASERRVAELAAGGRSNPEIAQALFVTRKTVEAHLRSVYMKLDVSGRGELASALKD